MRHVTTENRDGAAPRQNIGERVAHALPQIVPLLLRQAHTEFIRQIAKQRMICIRRTVERYLAGPVRHRQLYRGAQHERCDVGGLLRAVVRLQSRFRIACQRLLGEN